MSNILPKNSFSRIEVADRKIMNDADKFIKEALMGTFDLDRIKEIGNQALVGGVSGAPAGGLLGAIGGFGGAIATGIGENFVYNTKNNAQKASWQIGIAMEKIQKVASNIQKEIGVENSQFLSQLAADLKNYVDVFIEKKPRAQLAEDNILVGLKKQNDQQMYQQQMMNAAPNYSGQNMYSNYPVAKKRFKSQRFADLSDTVKGLGETGAYLATDAAGDKLGTDLAKEVLKKANPVTQPANLKNFLKGGVLGMGAGFAASTLLDAIENMTPALQQLQGLSSDLSKIFSEVQKLIADRPELKDINFFFNKILTFIEDLKNETSTKLQQAKSGVAAN